ncbi:MAG: hypothetical protein DRJ38_00055 [Thermoprotei archaeon]|nr:MAG: hypothetical protein DRJ38_00055 [Thermoprotei archaeon]
MTKRPTLRERVAALEVAVADLKSSVDDLRQSFRQNSRTIYAKLDNLESHVNQILGALDGFNPGLHRKEKAAITVAVITGLSSIIATLLQVLPAILH